MTKMKRTTTEKHFLKTEPQSPEEKVDVISVNRDIDVATSMSRTPVVMSTTTLITAAHSTTQSP